MIDRVGVEERERTFLSKYACKAEESKGRAKDEEPCQIRTCFQRDRDRIIHSKGFRRLMHKTQVFLAPEEDHFRTRLTHTLEVAQISRTIARGLCLNEDLTEAIALGHDLGHTPFGHNGEIVLNSIYPEGFKHNFQSLRIVEALEYSHGRRGLNLTYEVKDGILNHTGKGIPITLEGQVVKKSDRIAYINHDIDDALRGNLIREDELPKAAIKYLGQDHRTRISNLVEDMIKNSDDKAEIAMSSHAMEHMNKLREFMFEKVYHNTKVKKAGQVDKVETIIKTLYEYYMENHEKLPSELLDIMKEDNYSEIVKDYVAGMTDRYALNLYNELFVPNQWK